MFCSVGLGVLDMMGIACGYGEGNKSQGHCMRIANAAWGAVQRFECCRSPARALKIE